MTKIRKALFILLFLTLISPAMNPIVKGVEGNQLKNSILILYDQTTQTALNWYNFLKTNRYNVSIQPIQLIFADPTLLKNFDLIILDNSTNNVNGDRWKVEEYMRLADQNVPLIANGFGGWIIIKLSGLNTIRIYDKTSYLKVNLEDYQLSVFHTPYELEFLNQSSFLLLKISDIYYNSTLFLPADIDMVKTYYYRYSDCAIGKYEGYTKNLNIFFSFTYDPSALSDNGRKAYINLVEEALGGSMRREKTSLTIVSEDILFVNAEYTLIFKLTDEKENGVSANILIAFNESIIHQAYTNSEGLYLLNYTFTESQIGLLNITAYFEGTQIYESSSYTKNIIIEDKQLTFLNLTGPSILNYGEKGYYKANLVDENGGPLSGRRIELYVNNVLTSVNVTDSEGKTVFEYTAVDPGKIILKCGFNGEEQYQPCYSNNLEYDITIPNLKKTVLNLRIPQLVVVNEIISIEATLLDDSLNPLSGKNIYVLINSQLYDIGATDSNGVKNFSVAFNQSGKYNITVTYLGDSEYCKVYETSLIIIEAIPTKILLTLEKVTPDNTFRIGLKLLSEREQPLSNQSITVYWNGIILQTLITDEYGTITYTVKLGGELNKITLEFKYNGSEVYKPCSEICELTVRENILESGIPLGLTCITCCAIVLAITLMKVKDKMIIF